MVPAAAAEIGTPSRDARPTSDSPRSSTGAFSALGSLSTRSPVMKTLATFALAVLVAVPMLAQDPAPKAKEPAATDTKPSMQRARRMGEAKPLVMEKDREVYGAEVQLKEATKLPDIMKNPKEFTGRKLKIT